MSEDVLRALLAGNRDHVASLPEDYFADVRDGQHPAVVSVSCSDSRVSQEGMWDGSDPGWLFTPSNVGNQAWDLVDGERVVNGNLLYAVEHTGTRTVAVVGHTGCGAVTAAYRAETGDGVDEPAGIEKWVKLLRPVVSDGLAAGVVPEGADDATAIHRLVEYNVDRQVAFLREADDLPDDASVYGFVYDLHGVYGDEQGRTVLVNYEGETDVAAIAEEVPAEYRDVVERLLD